jgi:hypothetical protein
MADVDAALKDWSATSSSNKPTGGTTIGTGLDDNLREIQGSIVRNLSHKGADISSATTTDLGAVDGLMHDITGTTTITSFGIVREGILKIVKFEGVLTLTHNATSLILLNGANRTTTNGAVGIYISEGSGNWRELSYTVGGTTEGSWTPSLVGTGGGPLNYTAQVGRYVRTGNIVTLSCYVSISGGSAITGNVSITGFPFATFSLSNLFQSLCVGNYNLTLSANFTQVSAIINQNSQSIDLYQNGSGQAAGSVPSGSIGAGTFIEISGTILI